MFFDAFCCKLAVVLALGSILVFQNPSELPLTYVIRVSRGGGRSVSTRISRFTVSSGRYSNVDAGWDEEDWLVASESMFMVS